MLDLKSPVVTANTIMFDIKKILHSAADCINMVCTDLRNKRLFLFAALKTWVVWWRW